MEKLIATNPNAYRNYHISETLEAGIALTGTEIKSIRDGSPNLKDSYVAIKQKTAASLEAYLMHAHIAPYKHGNIWNHEPTRERKLLIHKQEIIKLFGLITQKGMTIVPTKFYFNAGRVKVELGIAKGKNAGDKRADMKKKSAQKEMDQAMKSRKTGRK
ncbi:MAG: SsrA-binding protein SmpB [Xanthomonadaceae bacterium]|nr:SsrA-binding protein SmpB [Xanthomonadaceae bacterium]